MVYIVLVNYKNTIDTEECLFSILNSSYSDYRVVIVDNSVIEEPFAQLQVFIKSKLPDTDYVFFREDTDKDYTFYHKINFIKARTNAGFAAANNLAIKSLLKQEDCQYIWFLNNDTVIKDDTLRHLTDFAEEHVSAGIIGTLIMEYNNPDEIQIISGLYHPSLARITAFREMSIEKGNAELPIDYVPGASMFVRREFLENVGLMNESFFLYFEELDWAIRAKKNGWKLNICLSAVIYHKGGQSINGKNKKVSDISDFYGLRNRILFTKIYYKYYLPLFFVIFFFIIFSRFLRGENTKAKNAFSLIPAFFKPTREIASFNLYENIC